LEAVREGVGPGAAAKIDGLKKDPMAKRAEALLAGKGWLPTLLR
jgi:ParB family transcriptional regulator, chromosome partitioning protein